MVSIPVDYYMSGGRRFRAPRSVSRRGGLRNPFATSYKHSRKMTAGKRRTKKRATVKRFSRAPMMLHTIGGKRRKTRKTRKGGAMSAGAVKRKISSLLRHL